MRDFSVRCTIHAVMSKPIAELELDSSTPLEASAKAIALPVEQRQLGGKLAGLTLPQQVGLLAIWPFMEQMLNFTVGFVDTMLAGHLSVAATEAMAAGAFLGWLLSLMQIALGVGAGAVVARAIGANHRRVANAALGQAILLAMAVGALAAVVVFTYARPMAETMGARGEAVDLTVLYLRIVCATAPISGLIFVGAASLRAAGDTRSPFIVLAVINVINVSVSAFLVYAPAPWGGHGVAGIAVGTAVAWIVGSILTLIWLIGGWGGIRLRWIRLRPHIHTMRRILRVSIPNVIEHSVHWIHHMFILMIIGKITSTQLGNEGALGAHIITIRLEGICYQPGFAIGVAASTLAGQYLGLGDPARAKRAAMLCWRIAVCLMGTVGLIFVLVPEMMVRLVTDEPQLLAITPNALRAAGVSEIFFATAIIMANTLRGAGDTRSSLLINLFSIYVLRLPLCYLFGVTFEWGFLGVWIACSIEMVFRAMLLTARFYHGGWIRARV